MDGAYEGDATRQSALDFGCVPLVSPKSTRVQLWQSGKRGTASAMRSSVCFVGLKNSMHLQSLRQVDLLFVDSNRNFDFFEASAAFVSTSALGRKPPLPPHMLQTNPRLVRQPSAQKVGSHVPSTDTSRLTRSTPRCRGNVPTPARGSPRAGRTAIA